MRNNSGFSLFHFFHFLVHPSLSAKIYLFTYLFPSFPSLLRSFILSFLPSLSPLTGILKIILDGDKRGHVAALDNLGADEQPGAMAHGCDRLLQLVHLLHQGQEFGVAAPVVWCACEHLNMR